MNGGASNLPVESLRGTAGKFAGDDLSSSGTSSDSRRSLQLDGWFIAIVVLLYLPLIFTGYGTDNDTFQVLDTGRTLLSEGRYQPSRNPGYLVFESAIGVLSRVGGSILCNAVTLAAAAVILHLFFWLCRRYAIPHRRLAAAAVLVVHPVFLINSTCTMDYLWAIAISLGGYVLLLKGRHLWGGVLLGLSMGTRLSAFIAAGIFLAHVAFEQRRQGQLGRVIAAGALAGVICLLCYFPSFKNAGYTLSFLRPHLGASEFWTAKLRAGRFVYKNIYLWGLPAALTGATILLWIAFRARANYADAQRRPFVLVSLALILGYEALFLKYPVDISYLLPMLPGVAVLLAVGLQAKPKILILFGAALFSHGLINFNIARPNVVGQATDAKLGIWTEPGVLVDDTTTRWSLRHCDSLETWKATLEAMGKSAGNFEP